MASSNKLCPANALSQAADYARQSWHVVVDNDVTLEDVLRPSFWAHHANKIQKFALIDVVSQDMTLDVQLRVLETGTGYVVTRVRIEFQDADKAAERKAEAAAADAGAADTVALPDEYKISMGKGGFVVTYVPTDAKIATGKKTRAEAVTEAKAHATKAGIAWPDAAPADVPTGT